MTDLEKKLIDYANAVIDNMCESQGVDVAIDDLIAFGFTKEELTEGLSFDSDDVNEYLGETDDDEYDDEDEELHQFTVKCHDIDYDVGWEDVESNYEVPTDLDEDDLDEWYDLKVDEIKASLPKEVILTVEATEEDLEDVIVDALSEETGWLIDSYKYDIIE